MSYSPPTGAWQDLWNHTLHWASLHYTEYMDDAILQPLFEKFKTKLALPAIPEVYEFPEVETLKIRRVREDEISALADMIIIGGSHPAENARRLILQFMSDPLVWPLIWEWQGRAIQFEAVTLGPDEEAYIGYLVHFKREHPQWFWGACEAPIRQWLEDRGYKKMKSLIRKNRAHRLERLQKVYNIRQVGEIGDFLRLEWNLSGDELPKWPARRATGTVFSYRNVICYEMQASDLADMQTQILALFKAAGLKSGPDTVELLAERWGLERAAVLLGFVDDKLKFVRTAREREPGQAAVSVLTPCVDCKESRIASYLSLQWLKALGYDAAVSFIPEVQFRAPSMKKYMFKIAPYLKELAQLPHHDGTVHEVGTLSIDSVLATPIADYVDAYTEEQ